MKTMRFQPGTFLEVDDLQGGRKVVLVGKDGVTMWDSVDTEKVTPVVVHPVFKPAELGSTVTFVKTKGLSQAAKKVLESLQVHMDPRAADSLFVMRVLWSLAPKVAGDAWTPDEAALQEACRTAAEQESLALRMHGQAEQYLVAR